MWKEKKRDRLKEVAKQEENTSGKREMAGERGRFEIKRRSLDCVVGVVFEGFSPRFLGSLRISSMCEPAVLLSVPDVAVPFSLVSVNSEVLFDSLMTDFFVHDNCFLREPVGMPNPVGDDRKE